MLGVVKGDVPWEKGFYRSSPGNRSSDFFMTPVDGENNNIKIDGRLADGAVVCESAKLSQATKDIKTTSGWSLLSTFRAGETMKIVTQKEGQYETQEECNEALKTKDNFSKQDAMYHGNPNPAQFECKSVGRKVYPDGCARFDLAGVTMSGKKSGLLVPVTIRRRLNNGVVQIAYYNISDMRDRGDGVIVWRYTTQWGWTLEKYIVPYSPYPEK